MSDKFSYLTPEELAQRTLVALERERDELRAEPGLIGSLALRLFAGRINELSRRYLQEYEALKPGLLNRSERRRLLDGSRLLEDIARVAAEEAAWIEKQVLLNKR